MAVTASHQRENAWPTLSSGTRMEMPISTRRGDGRKGSMPSPSPPGAVASSPLSAGAFPPGTARRMASTRLLSVPCRASDTKACGSMLASCRVFQHRRPPSGTAHRTAASRLP